MGAGATIGSGSETPGKGPGTHNLDFQVAGVHRGLLGRLPPLLQGGCRRSRHRSFELRLGGLGGDRRGPGRPATARTANARAALLLPPATCTALVPARKGEAGDAGGSRQSVRQRSGQECLRGSQASRGEPGRGPALVRSGQFDLKTA